MWLAALQSRPSILYWDLHMGIQDRDWYREKHRQPSSGKTDEGYSPKQFRRGNTSTDGNIRNADSLRGGNSKSTIPTVRHWLIWALILAVLTWIFHTFPRNEGSAIRSTSVVSMPASRPCASMAMPGNGAVKIEDPSIMNRSDVAFSGIQLENRYALPLTVTLTTADASANIAPVMVHPGESAVLSAPVGGYGMRIATGTSWCDDTFADARLTNVQNGITLPPGKTTRLTIAADKSQASGLRLTLDQAGQPPPLFTPDSDSMHSAAPSSQPYGNGSSMILAADRLGHYRVDGEINNHPLRFLLDTGATGIAIPRRFANEAGIYSCAYKGNTQTANGTISRCTTRISSLHFGIFRIDDVDVDILDNMEGEGLLGMDVLRRFSLAQENGRLRLTPASVQ
jgi:aspartyl protease family protein